MKKNQPKNYLLNQPREVSKRTLQDLTIKDNFMFAAVMMRGDNCKKLLEMVLGIEIAHVKVDYERCIVYNPKYKGVRIDVYAKDEQNTYYSVEMQIRKEKALGKRARYYHGQADMEILQTGIDYEDMPSGYVIFICDYTPYEGSRYRYTFENRCREEQKLTMADGSVTIVLSTCGENPDEVPEALVKFLKYVHAELKDSEADYDDPYVNQLQESVAQIKKDREMENKFMMTELWIRDERKEAKAEGILEGMANSIFAFLEDLGTVPTEVSERIHAEEDLAVLTRWNKLAARSESVEQFISQM